MPRNGCSRSQLLRDLGEPLGGIGALSSAASARLGFTGASLGIKGARLGVAGTRLGVTGTPRRCGRAPRRRRRVRGGAQLGVGAALARGLGCCCDIVARFGTTGGRWAERRTTVRVKTRTITC